MRDDLVERVAEALWREDFRRGAGRERITPWAEAGDHPHMQWRSLARAALAIIEPAVREECAKVADDKAALLDKVAEGFGIMPSVAAPYAIRATDARDLASAIRAGAKP